MKIIGVFVVLFFTMLEDVQSRKIRNVWVLLIFALNLILSLGKAGVSGSLLYLGKMGLWLLALYVFCKMRLLGAGDVKLLTVLAAGIPKESFIWFWLGCLGSATLLALEKVAKAWRQRQKGKMVEIEGVPLALPIWFGYVTVLMGKGVLF